MLKVWVRKQYGAENNPSTHYWGNPTDCNSNLTPVAYQGGYIPGAPQLRMLGPPHQLKIRE